MQDAPKIDYKDVKLLGRFISERGKIVPRRISGLCAKNQRKVTRAVKRARKLALLPYTSGTTGLPKGCIHTHRTLMHNVVGGGPWGHAGPETVSLGVVPMFHITGFVYGVLGSVTAGSTTVRSGSSSTRSQSDARPTVEPSAFTTQRSAPRTAARPIPGCSWH